MYLTEGSSGTDVTYLQYGVKIMCFDPVGIDGYFGPGTLSAVKGYQAYKGLTADGIVGDGTWGALQADIKNIQTLLKNKAYYTGNIDGVAGTGTYNALLAFQHSQGITADGECGPITLSRLKDSGGTSYPTLQKGSTGSYVVTLQQKLIALGYSVGSAGADGDFGNGTYNAVVSFQEDYGLAADGVVGPSTWNAVLGAASAPNNGYLKKGSTGSAVVALQQKLISLGYSVGSSGADGNFGTGTYNAVIAFQNDHGLTADGIVGPQTQTALDNATPSGDSGVLREGSSGSQVFELQQMLMSLGYNCGIYGADGIFGDATYNAVIAFQRDHGLTQDGIVGPNTYNALYNALNGSSGGGSGDSNNVPTNGPGKLYSYEANLINRITSLNTTKFSYDISRFRNIYSANAALYQSIAQATGVPAVLIAAIHYRESNCNFNTYLQNGDPLGAPTTHVPKGIYYTNFHDSAVAAMNDQSSTRAEYGLSAGSTDLVAMAAFAETYNGLGYYNYHNMPSPYVYSGTNVYTSGKYVADGKFSSTAVDQQPGTFLLIKQIS